VVADVSWICLLVLRTLVGGITIFTEREETKMDRFTFVDKPPVIVGSCTVCHDDIQRGYEKRCGFCEELVCEDCLRECWVCQKKGCKLCIEKKDANKEYVCDECLASRWQLKLRVMGSTYIEGYYHSGTSETDEETVIKYTSLNDGPPIEVRIKKVRD